MMKRYLQEPTDENIWSSLRDNISGRNKDIKAFIEGLQMIEGNAYISIDAKWGEGKTFFVRQIEEVLKYFYEKNFNYGKKDKEKLSYHEYIKAAPEIRELQIDKLYLPVYYNAWMYDNHNDPLMSLLLCITKTCKGFYDTEINSEKLGKKLLSIMSAFTVSMKGIEITPGNMIPNMESIDILSVVKTEEEIRNQVADIFKDVIAERTEKLIILIDELDRCRPFFAIEMLERVKHYFDDKRIVFIVSVNKSEFVHTIENYYGKNFDATRYLNRFFDFNISIPPISSSLKYSLKNYNDSDIEQVWFKLIADGLSDYYHLTFRDILIYKGRLEAVSKRYINDRNAQGMILSIFVPIIIVLEMVNEQAKNIFIEGNGEALLNTFFEQINSFKEVAQRLSNYNIRNNEMDSGYKNIIDAYTYTFKNGEEKYFAAFDLSREIKSICLRACNGF